MSTSGRIDKLIETFERLLASPNATIKIVEALILAEEIQDLKNEIEEIKRQLDK